MPTISRPYSDSPTRPPADEFRFALLGSGSKGNAAVVQYNDTTLLIDAGLSHRQISMRLRRLGLSMDDISACLITHEHQDHIRGLSLLAKRHQLPVFMHPLTFRFLENVGVQVEQHRFFEEGEQWQVGSMGITSFPLPHDSRSAVGFILQADGLSLGYFTDLGEVQPPLVEAVSQLDWLILEANHDPQMLVEGPYPVHIKERIASPRGHLSNLEAAELVSEAQKAGKLRGVVLAHLSETNNTPAIALKAFNGLSAKFPKILVAEQREPTPWITLEER